MKAFLARYRSLACSRCSQYSATWTVRCCLLADSSGSPVLGVARLGSQNVPVCCGESGAEGRAACPAQRCCAGSDRAQHKQAGRRLAARELVTAEGRACGPGTIRGGQRSPRAVSLGYGTARAFGPLPLGNGTAISECKGRLPQRSVSNSYLFPLCRHNKGHRLSRSLLIREIDTIGDAYATSLSSVMPAPHNCTVSGKELQL